MRDRVVNVSTINKAFMQTTRLSSGYVWPAVETVGARHVRKRVPVGGRPNTFKSEKPFLHTSLKVNYPSGSVQVESWTGDVYKYTGQGSLSISGYHNNLELSVAYPPGKPVKYGPDTGTAISLDLRSQAEVKCLNKLRDQSGQEDLDFGLWYGERRETVRLFTEGAVGLLNLARSIAQKDYRKSAEVLRDAFGVSTNAKAERARMKRLERRLRKEMKGAPKLANQTLKGLEDAALTYNLGISPLVNDLQTIHRRLLTGDLTAKTAVKAVARYSRYTEGSETLKIDRLGCLNTVQFNDNHGYTVTLVAVPSHSDRARLSRLGLTNPINTMYQLTGLTFLLDYFYSMGPFLQALTVPMEFQFHEGSYCQRITRNITQVVQSSLGKMTGVVSLNHTERKLYTKFPVPLPPLSLRGRELSLKQSINTGLIALKQLRSLVGSFR